MSKSRDLLDKLAAEEDRFFKSEFLSPVLRNHPIRVRIAGVTVQFQVQPRDFQGWGVFQPVDQKRARFVREPTMSQKQQYLSLYPRFSLIVCRQDTVSGIPAHQSDTRITINGQVPILLPNEVRLFDTVDVRWDGENFWYDQHSANRSPRVATTLRDMLAEETKPEKAEVAGMTVEERLAYAIAFDLEIEAKKDRKEERLRHALERGGALLRSYVERGNTYTVEFTVEGERHRSVVDSQTLQVTSAGICLSGYDRNFDLQSLVGVIREGQHRHLIHRVGNNL
jgi:hypothetical protein